MIFSIKKLMSVFSTSSTFNIIGNTLSQFSFLNLFTLTEKLAMLGCDWKFDTNGQQLNGLMHHIFLYEDALDKNQFFQKLNRIQVIHSQILRTINYILGIKNSKTPSDSGSSIYG